MPLKIDSTQQTNENFAVLDVAIWAFLSALSAPTVVLGLVTSLGDIGLLAFR